MKKILIASLLTSATFCASADMLIGGDIEMNAWQQDQTFNDNDGGSNTAYTFEGSIEHFVPLIPNVKYSQSSVDGEEIKYTKRDFTLYYEFLDNDLVSLDAGIGITNLSNGEVKGISLGDFEGSIPHLYAAAEIGIPGTPLFIFAKGNGVSYNNNNMMDYSVGAQFSIPMVAFDLELQVGYRAQRFDLDGFDDLPVDIDTQTDGVFAGVNIDF